jgi:ribosomal protein S24E
MKENKAIFKVTNFKYSHTGRIIPEPGHVARALSEHLNLSREEMVVKYIKVATGILMYVQAEPYGREIDTNELIESSVHISFARYNLKLELI